MSRWQEEARWYRQRVEFAEAEASELRNALPIARRDPRIQRASIRQGEQHLRQHEAEARACRRAVRRARPWWWFW